LTVLIIEFDDFYAFITMTGIFCNSLTIISVLVQYTHMHKKTSLLQNIQVIVINA
jgi:hypothetical protein